MRGARNVAERLVRIVCHESCVEALALKLFLDGAPSISVEIYRVSFLWETYVPRLPEI